MSKGILNRKPLIRVSVFLLVLTIAISLPTIAPAVAWCSSIPGMISGVVTDEYGNPIGGAQLNILDPYGAGITHTAYTAGDGTYIIPVSSHTVAYGCYVFAKASGYAVQFYNNTNNIYEATIVFVPPGDELNINFILGSVSNECPVASFTYSPENPTVGQEITFDASSSYDPDGQIVSYDWDFGDGNSAQEEVVTHAYVNAGDYISSLTVTDNGGLQGSTNQTITVSYPPPTIEKIDAKMVSPNELGIGVSVTYPTSMPSNALKSLTVQATINGQPVEKTFDITQLRQKQMFDNKGVLLATTPLRINLETAGVPRFTDNVKFTVTAVASYEGSAPSDPKPCDVKVLLPIVVIHGYEFKITKNNWVFHLFAYKAAYKSLSDELINQGYSHSDTYGKTKLLDYRTLWDPSDSVAQYGDVRYLTEAQILQMMNNVMLEVNEHSYASKVNLVGHSFGGLIARDYAAKHSSNVNTVITVGTPHLGTTGFYDIVLKHYHSVEDVLLKIPADRIVYWTVPTYKNALIYADGSQAYNLFPNTLVGVGMANGVNYFCIYSDSNTQTTRTLIVQNSGTPWYTIVRRQLDLGDGYIPAISAAGNNQFGEPIRLLNIGANHATLMNEYETQSIIEEKLMKFK